MEKKKKCKKDRSIKPKKNLTQWIKKKKQKEKVILTYFNIYYNDISNLLNLAKFSEEIVIIFNKFTKSI